MLFKLTEFHGIQVSDHPYHNYFVEFIEAAAKKHFVSSNGVCLFNHDDVTITRTKNYSMCETKPLS